MPRITVEHNWQELNVYLQDGVVSVTVEGMYTSPYYDTAFVGDTIVRLYSPLETPMPAEGITVDWNLWRCRGTYRYARIVVTTEGFTVFWRNHDGSYSQVFAATFAERQAHHIRVTNHTKTRYVRNCYCCRR